MFGAIRRLFGGRRASDGTQLCMVMLDGDRAPGPEMVLGEVRRLFPSRQVTLQSRDEQMVAFEVDGFPVFAAHMGFPIPPEEIDYAAQRSWMWEDAREQVRRQKTHVLVTSPGDPDDQLGGALAIACVAAGVCAAAKAIGVYWGRAGHVLEAEMFVECASEEDQIPVPLLVSVAISQDPDRGTLEMTTLGLDGLGHRDFEVLNTSMDAQDLAGTALDLAAYVLQNGPVLQHGHTFGPTMEDKWRVEHAKSKLDPRRKVIRLHIP